jgi:thiol-disulfide isomerase/thioredoxin
MRDTVLAFGVPDRFADALSKLLPVAELLTAAALLPTVTARAGAVAAAVLLVVFTGGVANALRQGRTPNCNCFGQVSSEAISARTLARNAAFIVLAGLSIWRGAGASLLSWTSNLDAANLVAAIAVIVASLAAFAVFQLRALLTAARTELTTAVARGAKPGLQPGEAAPEFVLPNLVGGGHVTLTSLLERGVPAVLLFASQSCGPCMQMLPEVVRWSETLSERLTFVLIESGVEDPTGLAGDIAGLGSLLTLVDDQHEVAQLYGVTMTPSGLIVDAEGRILTNQSSGGGNIEGMVRSALNSDPADVVSF